MIGSCFLLQVWQEETGNSHELAQVETHMKSVESLNLEILSFIWALIT